MILVRKWEEFARQAKVKEDNGKIDIWIYITPPSEKRTEHQVEKWAKDFNES